MEELKKEQQEETYEQRPSRKYGRTAYQEQLKREQAEHAAQEGQNWQQQNTSYGQQSWGEQNTGYGQQSWGEQNTGYGQQNWRNQNPYEAAKPQVKDTFAYILMVLVAVSAVIGIGASLVTLDAFEQIRTIDYYLLFKTLASSAVYNLLSNLSSAVSIAVIVLLVLDINRIYKANYKIVGLILFAIFLRPAYFIWRAHILGKKKTVSVIYTVLFYGVQVAQFLWIFGAVFRFVESL